MEYFFKTKVCPRLKSNGTCRRGSNCPFAHSEEELRPLPDLQKTKLCSNFILSRKCIAGDTCTFAHGEHELRIGRRTANNLPMSDLKRSIGNPYFEPCIANHTHRQAFFLMNDMILNNSKSSPMKLERLQKLLQTLGEKNDEFARGCDDEHVNHCLEMGLQESYSQPCNFSKMQGFKRTRRGKRGGRNKNPNCRAIQSCHSSNDFEMETSRFSRLAALLSSLSPPQAQLCLELLEEERRKDTLFNDKHRGQQQKECNRKDYLTTPWQPSSSFHDSKKFSAASFDNINFLNNGKILSEAIQNTYGEPWGNAHFEEEIDYSVPNLSFPNAGNQGMYYTGTPGTLFDSLKSISSSFDGYPTERTIFSTLSASDYFTEGDVEDRTTVALPQNVYFGTDAPLRKELSTLESNQNYLDSFPTFLPQ
ncbi:hypothetical protein IE077_000386 [Cardiosporidium cionae]|uniref:C3H1-type domain-containing protein n=1 Tax=Cardiosporidium cionae TaxID=476202 RepID=A0ABQ7JAE5_9APIC|nr:hypothetical protein IE077_000386 [Cardiosporidium cionae]|eukprot:KAF8820904.1 hypothetical protein IE077_000386 [Cardiosporidium cionae]